MVAKRKLLLLSRIESQSFSSRPPTLLTASRKDNVLINITKSFGHFEQDAPHILNSVIVRFTLRPRFLPSVIG
jgi:hypothetical protein